MHPSIEMRSADWRPVAFPRPSCDVAYIPISSLIIGSKPAVVSGEVLLPAGQGPVAPISREDVATAIVAIASQPGTHGQSYAVTGHRALTLDEIVAAFSDVAGRPIRYSVCTRSDYLAWTWANLEDPWPHAFSTLCESISEGRFGRVSKDFAELVGHEPESLSQYLRRSFSAGAPSGG